MENKLDLSLANAIIETLWIKGLLTDAEQSKVKIEVAKTFSLKKVEKTTGRMNLIAV